MIDRWMDGWREGWMDRWTDEYMVVDNANIYHTNTESKHHRMR